MKLKQFSKAGIQWVSLFTMLIFTSLACQRSKNISEETMRSEILKMHNLQRDYHFNKMAKAFAAQLSQDHISVNRGEIETPSNSEHVSRFDNYFNSIDFEKWDDINPPIIRFSDDYSLAYTIVDKEVIVTYKDGKGELQKELRKFCLGCHL